MQKQVHEKLDLKASHFCFASQSYSQFTLSSHSAGTPLAGSTGLLSAQELEDIVAALPGFLLVFTAEGKLLYLSESVSEHLGHYMVSAEDPFSLDCSADGDTMSFPLLRV